MLLNDKGIAMRCCTLTHQMIKPFTHKQVKEENGKRILSYGLSSFGYDVRLAEDLKMFAMVNAEGRSLLTEPLDPMNLKPERDYITVKPDSDGSVTIPPGGFLLGHTLEYIHVPRDILIVCMGKSTYARLGLVVNVTPLEPEWHGQVVIEISNTATRPVKVYVGQGIAQFLFHKGENCEVSYADRGGKYQGQTGVTTAKV